MASASEAAKIGIMTTLVAIRPAQVQAIITRMLASAGPNSMTGMVLQATPRVKLSPTSMRIWVSRWRSPRPPRNARRERQEVRNARATTISMIAVRP